MGNASNGSSHSRPTLKSSATRSRCDVAKLDDEHSSPGTVLRNPQQVDNANKTAAPGKLRRDIREANLEHLRDDDLARRERISASDLHVRSLPQAHRRRDLTVANAIAELSKELHRSLGLWRATEAPNLQATPIFARLT
jgi:hypothetical protein